jgi:sugar lactone lactonase YvrE
LIRIASLALLAGLAMNPSRVAVVGNLKQPESALYDAQQDVWFVSNINGESLKKDGNGFISRIKSDGTIERKEWARGLDAPKGMAIVGDTLWVSDIDVMRAYNRRTGASITTIDLSVQNATFLNDVAVGGDSAIYITDTSVKPDARGNLEHRTTDKIFRIGSDRRVTVALSSDRLMRPNGIVWDDGRFIVVPFGGDSIRAWRPGSQDLETLATGPGQFDGVIRTKDGRILLSSQSTASVHELKDGQLVELIKHLPGCADIGYDDKNEVVAVPLTGSNRVEFYRLDK